MVQITLSNAKDKRFARLAREVLATEVGLVKEYACVQGLLALCKGNLANIDFFHKAMVKIKEDHPPMYT
jgi:hypothetical protein